MSTLVIIQGPIFRPLLHESRWSKNQILFSSWKEDNTSGIPIILSEKPEYTGVGNVNLQKTTTLRGLYYAREIGYSHCLKIRSDLFPTNNEKLIGSFDPDKLNFIAKHRQVDGEYDGYLVDYLQYGKTEDLILLWENVEINSSSFAELALTKSYLKNFSPENSHFILNSLDSSSDLWWERSKIYLSQYRYDGWYRDFW